jgi:hypothetical protein
MQHLEQRLRDLWKIIVEATMHACREEREPLEQSLTCDFGLAGLQPQASTFGYFCANSAPSFRRYVSSRSY